MPVGDNKPNKRLAATSSGDSFGQEKGSGSPRGGCAGQPTIPKKHKGARNVPHSAQLHNEVVNLVDDEEATMIVEEKSDPPSAREAACRSKPTGSRASPRESPAGSGAGAAAGTPAPKQNAGISPAISKAAAFMALTPDIVVLVRDQLDTESLQVLLPGDEGGGQVRSDVCKIDKDHRVRFSSCEKKMQFKYVSRRNLFQKDDCQGGVGGSKRRSSSLGAPERHEDLSIDIGIVRRISVFKFTHVPPRNKEEFSALDILLSKDDGVDSTRSLQVKSTGAGPVIITRLVIVFKCSEIELARAVDDFPRKWNEKCTTGFGSQSVGAFVKGSKKPNGDTARESSLSWELFYQVWDVRLREQTSATEKQREQETEREAEVDGGESKRGRERRAVGDGAGVSLRNQRVEGERAKGEGAGLRGERAEGERAKGARQRGEQGNSGIRVIASEDRGEQGSSDNVASEDRADVQQGGRKRRAIRNASGDGALVSVTRADLQTLDDEELLNDTVMDFYIKYIEENLSPHQRAECHFFSTFFWKRLSQEKGAQARHAGVAKWTRKVDIFSKRFLFVPICESLHWTLAIICAPAAIAKLDEQTDEQAFGECWLSPPTRTPAGQQVQQAQQAQLHVQQAQQQGAAAGATTTPDPLHAAKKGDSDGEMEEEGEAAHARDADEQQQAAAEKEQLHITLYLDSLGGYKKQAIEKLGDYLRLEWHKKRGPGSDADIAAGERERAAGGVQVPAAGVATEADEGRAEADEEGPRRLGRIAARALCVPQQANSCDCGVFVLKYIELFTKEFVGEEAGGARASKKWFTNPDKTIKSKRREIRELVERLASEYAAQQQQQTQQQQEQQEEEKKEDEAVRGASAEEEEDEQPLVSGWRLSSPSPTDSCFPEEMKDEKVSREEHALAHSSRVSHALHTTDTTQQASDAATGANSRNKPPTLQLAPTLPEQPAAAAAAAAAQRRQFLPAGGLGRAKCVPLDTLGAASSSSSSSTHTHTRSAPASIRAPVASVAPPSCCAHAGHAGPHAQPPPPQPPPPHNNKRGRLSEKVDSKAKKRPDASSGDSPHSEEKVPDSLESTESETEGLV